MSSGKHQCPYLSQRSNEFARLLGKQVHYDVALLYATSLTLPIACCHQLDHKSILLDGSLQMKFPHGCNQGPFQTLPEVVGGNLDQVSRLGPHLDVPHHLSRPILSLRVTPPLNINLDSPLVTMHRPQQLLNTMLYLTINHSPQTKIVWRPQYGIAPHLRSCLPIPVNLDRVEASP